MATLAHVALQIAERPVVEPRCLLAWPGLEPAYRQRKRLVELLQDSQHAGLGAR